MKQILAVWGIKVEEGIKLLSQTIRTEFSLGKEQTHTILKDLFDGFMKT